jgi:phthiocerol/phenolphthiocerol synthesis type-I polyketide synthase E
LIPVDDLSDRPAPGPPERRRQLSDLLRARTKPGGRDPLPDDTGLNVPPLLLDARPPSEPSAVKADYKQFYDAVSSQLNASGFGQFSYFLNYGYVSDGGTDHSVVGLPARFFNKNSVRLVLELIGDCPIDGSEVLDVGCGRGGTIYALKKFFEPATLTGLDLSTTAIEFDRRAHGDSRTLFHQGDAENLPFADESFDVVTNVESSHSYPNVDRFYAEVYRVLRPGGFFLYTDVLAVQQITTVLAELDRLGFRLEVNRNITNSVLLSCDEVAEARVEAFGHRNDPGLMQNFLATPGSQVYDEMRTGRWEYRIFRAAKPECSRQGGD